MNILLRMYPGDACALLIANVLVQVAVVSLTAGLVARLGTRWNAAWRYSVYCVAIVCVLSSPLLSCVMQATGMAMVTLRPSTRAATSAEPAQIPISQVSQASLGPLPAAPLLAESSPHPQAEILRQELRPASPSTHSLPDILRAFTAVGLMIWLLGMALLLARWCYGLRLIALLRRASQPLDCEAMVAVLHEVRRNLGVERLPPLAVSVHLDRPVMVGLVRPLVILPEDVLRNLHGPELGDVLVHECAHVICRHQAVGLLQRLAGMLFWPHPLVYLLNAHLARAREEVCDNYVLRRRAAPCYARTLLELSQLFVNSSPQPTALGLFSCRWRLEDRVANLLDRRRKVMVRINRWAAAALAATFLSFALVIAGIQVVQAEPKESKPGQKPAAEALRPESSTQGGAASRKAATLPVSGVPVSIADDSYFRLGYDMTVALVLNADVAAKNPRDYKERDLRIAAAVLRRGVENWHISIGDGTPQHQLFRDGTLRAQADLTLAREKGSDAKERVEAVYKWWDITTKWTAEEWKARQVKTTEIRKSISPQPTGFYLPLERLR